MSMTITHAAADPHRRVLELLPWHLNGTLDAAEREAVERHLEHCADCRRELELLAELRAAVREDAPAVFTPRPDVDGFLSRLDSGAGRGRRRRRAALVAAAAGAAVLIAFGGLRLADREPSRYRTVTSPPQETTYHYAVAIELAAGVDAGAREALFGEILAQAGAQAGPEAVSGPDEQGRYTLVVPLEASSLGELDAFNARLAARGEIEAVETVGLRPPDGGR